MENCSRSACWYKHERVITNIISSTTENTPDEWIENELDSESTDFQESLNPPAPPNKQNTVYQPENPIQSLTKQ